MRERVNEGRRASPLQRLCAGDGSRFVLLNSLGVSFRFLLPFKT